MTHLELIIILELAATVTQALCVVAILFTVRQIAREGRRR
jgi:hypothetical protein